jgi:murein DD-endopeptidase MepM/ murein hydrolase activator NlpD
VQSSYGVSRKVWNLMGGAALVALAACTNTFDYDLRDGFSRNVEIPASTARPAADNRGVISYPSFQVAVARKGDTVATLAARVGLPAADLARYNGLTPGVALREGEVMALPTRVAEPSPATGALTTGPIGGTSDQIDVTTLAGSAIDRAEASGAAAAPAPAAPAAAGPAGSEPLRHKVVRGETAYTIARAYNVSVRALADWNGLGPDLSVREGQYLLIPVAAPGAAPATSTAPEPKPGQGSPTPNPPSAATPLPANEAAASTDLAPPSPDLGAQRSTQSRLAMPVDGRIIREYVKKKNDGIDISAAAGAPVKAAEDGVVAAITKDTEQVPIIVIRHKDNLLTVYAGVDAITVKKGDTVKRGQVIAKVRAANPPFLHFEVREGFESVDPVPYLN